MSRLRLKTRHAKLIALGIMSLITIGVLGIVAASFTHIDNLSSYSNNLFAQNASVSGELVDTKTLLASVSAELQSLKNEDQRLINQELNETISLIEETYQVAVLVYEELLDLQQMTQETAKFEERFAETLSLLSQKKYQESAQKLDLLNKDITSKQQEIIAAAAQKAVVDTNAPVSNTPPGSGYSRQQVQADIGTYLISLVAADLNTTRVIVDTASAGDCANDCPVLPLGDYVARNGGFAGVNGSYFCPASYPSCAGKANSFDTLLMNKDKVYFNSANNVYSTVPAVIFSGSSARYVGKSQEWGRDTGVDAVIANHPLLVSGSNVVFGGDGDPKKGSKSPRGFIGSKGSTVYIGIVHSATVAEAAHALKALGLEYALNLDGGGSAALWSGGYKVGPGRALPNAIVLVGK
jgi:exopolysaccharide biosynthesis protein